ncbi:MAG TPA: glycerate kinase [Candidatus Coprenecus stercoravium]|uniref:Glycerate kinase n=1 Tax=Candidatus Coprenecus stercoravium TaxID=2840735 RepID=A0A9D2GQ22_9BACT|nr:glycerate kinase [Candidatus Coprenecus stercoravium]
MRGCNKIVVAIDKFKSSMTAVQAAEAIRDGLECGSHIRGAEIPDIMLCPMADGGEGSMGVMERAFNKKDIGYGKIFIDTVNHIGQPIMAPVLLFEEEGVTNAFIEMASVCGLNMVPRDKRNLLRSTTYGLGSVIRSVIETHGVRRILMAIGGSGTNDGGFGMLTALGWSFSNSNPFRNRDIPTFISGIESASDRSVCDITPHLKDTGITVISDVASPLLGSDGATAVYGPQKGCRRQDIPLFENALSNWQKVIGHPDFPGAGAAGGVGYALKAALGAKFVPGWRFFASALELEKEIASADLVITGEGRFDRSSLSGKLPSGIAKMCRQYGKPLWIVTGQNKITEAECLRLGISKVFELSSLALPEEHPVQDAPAIIRRVMAAAITLPSPLSPE